MSNNENKNLFFEDNKTEDENISSDKEEKKIKIQCEGCYYNSMNQYDHMDYGGCMYVPDCGITIRGKRYRY